MRLYITNYNETIRDLLRLRNIKIKAYPDYISYKKKYNSIVKKTLKILNKIPLQNQDNQDSIPTIQCITDTYYLNNSNSWFKITAELSGDTSKITEVGYKYYYHDNNNDDKNYIGEDKFNDELTYTKTITTEYRLEDRYTAYVYVQTYFIQDNVKYYSEITLINVHEASCLLKGTLLTLNNYEKKPIEEITYNDTLLVWDFDKGEFSSAKPIYISNRGIHNEYTKLTFSDNYVINVVHRHRLFNKNLNKFIYDNEFSLNDITFNEKGEEIRLISREIIKGEVEYYSVMTNYHINLFSEGILTSSRLNNIYPISNMKYIKDTLNNNNVITHTLSQTHILTLTQTQNNFIEILKGFNIQDRYLNGFRLYEQNLDWIEMIKFLNERHLLYSKNNIKDLNTKFKYLFLDHQGVLNDHLSKFKTFNDKDISILNKLILKYDLNIIVSSDWTRFMTKDEIEKLYVDSKIQKLPIDYTDSNYVSQKISKEENRARQIFKKMNELNISFTDCLIIDDLDLQQYFPFTNYIYVKDGLGLKSLTF
jgi:hypothetical protein